MNKIKVIKKGESGKSEAVTSDRRTKREAAREMVANVSNWVSDFQDKKRDEARIAFDQLFAKQPRTNEA